MWVFRELEEWLNSADPEFQEAMSATKFQLQTYKQQIASHVEHRELVPERLYALTSRIIFGIISWAFPIMYSRWMICFSAHLLTDVFA